MPRLQEKISGPVCLKCELCGWDKEPLKTTWNGYRVCSQCFEGELDPNMALPVKEI